MAADHSFEDAKGTNSKKTEGLAPSLAADVAFAVIAKIIVSVKEEGIGGKLQLEEVGKNFGDRRSGVGTGRTWRRSPMAIIPIIY